jgi:uncharacterized membrane protein
VHSLKALSLLSWFSLLICQLGLFWPDYQIDIYWVLLLVLPLLFPAPGLLKNRRYTYRWIGFMTMVYFCVGISELVSNPQLRLYGFGTTISSALLFLSSIYYARYLNTVATRATNRL